MVRIAWKSTCDTFAEPRQVRLNEKVHLRYAQLYFRYAQICVVNYGSGGHFFISSQTAFGLADLELSRLHLYEEFLFKTCCNLCNLVNFFKSQSQQVQKRCAHSQIFPKKAKCTCHYKKAWVLWCFLLNPPWTMAVFLVTYPSCLNANHARL